MKYLYTVIIVFSLFSCSDITKHSPSSLFSQIHDLKKISSNFDEDSFGRIEGMQSNDSTLIIFDYHSENSFSLFDIQTEKLIGRFGTIGQGPGEIPLGCVGYIDNDNFCIFYDVIGLVAKFQIDSLKFNIKRQPTRLPKYQIDKLYLSKIALINDSILFGAGTYNSRFQFILFDKNNTVIDYNVEIFNANENKFNEHHKYLSNQGNLTKNPSVDKFAYVINYSSNLDIIEVVNNKIRLVKSLRFRNPNSSPFNRGELFGVIPDKNSAIGYIDISSGEKYIYALYTDKKMVESNGNRNHFNSNIILVFDWEGNPIKKLILEKEAYYISVNEKSNELFSAIITEDGYWNIDRYKLH